MLSAALLPFEIVAPTEKPPLPPPPPIDCACKADELSPNVEIDASLDRAKEIARRLRETLDVRALGLQTSTAIQVSTNIEDHRSASPADVVEAIAALAGRGAIGNAELVGLAPSGAFAGFPSDVPLTGLQTIEDALARRSANA